MNVVTAATGRPKLSPLHPALHPRGSRLHQPSPHPPISPVGASLLLMGVSLSPRMGRGEGVCGHC